MSHHLDSELSRRDSRLDLTDQYIFRGTSGTALVMNVNSTILGADYRQGFHPDARYEFKIHLDGSPVEDLTYRFTFGPTEDDDSQSVTLHSTTGGAANRVHPESDVQADAERLAGIVAALVAANRTSDDPAAYGRAVARRLLPDLMPYRIGTAASFGFAGVNGRALADNAVEVMFCLAFNAAMTLGLRPEHNAETRSDEFPYVVATR